MQNDQRLSAVKHGNIHHYNSAGLAGYTYCEYIPVLDQSFARFRLKYLRGGGVDGDHCG